ncbi:MAG: tetratricopeptide repeat protein [Desulfobacteraceae bacterium]|nr:tetratricopeptide repeat protein [Desulfobacteraceae bacterium]
MAESDTLKRFIEIKKPVLWVGAGLSIDAGLPTVGRLADQLWDEYAFTPKPPEKDPYALIDAFHRQEGKGDLNHALSKIIPAGVKTRPSHHALARMAKADCFSEVITTNYDKLVDNAFAEHEVDYLPQILDGNQEIRKDERLRLFKIHGDVSDWKKVILTGESYSTFKDRYRFLYNQFNTLLTQNPVLFIGCSMLDDRVLDWLEALSSEAAELVPSWMAILTTSDQEILKQHERSSGSTAWEILHKISFHVLNLPDYATLPLWLENIARKIAGYDTQRQELILNIHTTDKSAPGNWPVTLDGHEVVQPALPLDDQGFIQKLEQLEDMIHRPLPCDSKGVMEDKDKKLEAEICKYAVSIGTALAGILDAQGRRAVLAAMNGNTIPLLRIVVDGNQADRVLALPWELLWLDSRFPVEEAKLDIVREVKKANAPGLDPRSSALKVLVHIAAPEDDAGQGALMYEEEAYRLVLSMQQAAGSAVAFTDLGSVRDLVRGVERIDPTVVHFTGHGSPGTLLFEDKTGDRIEVPISELLKELRTSAVGGQPALPRVFYLASCYGASGKTASAPAPQGFKQLSELGAVKGEGASTAATLQREGCPAVVAYFGPVGDQLSTHAEVAFYGGLVKGKRLTESVRSARITMARPLGEKDLMYRYPLGWAQLALYLRGDDLPIAEKDAVADDLHALEQELYRADSPVHSLDMLRSGTDGFIGRRKDLAMLRQRHIRGRRIFVLHGLGGIGKTALAVNLIPKLRVKPDRVMLLDAVRAEEAADPVQDLWEQLADQIQKAFPGLLARILDAHKENQDPLTMFDALIKDMDADKPWLIYLDNAESLQTHVTSETGDLGAWDSPGMDKWWRIAATGTTHGGPLTLVATTRYLLKDSDRQNSWAVGVLRSADIARMMRWFPFLRTMPHAQKKNVVEWLNGHARALIYLEGLLKEIIDPLTPENDISADTWRKAIEEALPGTEGKLVSEDLLLSHIWKRLDPPAQNQLRALTALRRPAPLDAVKKLGDQTARLENLGLLTRFPGEFRSMHAVVHGFVKKQVGKARPEDHLPIGLWYKDAYEADKQLLSAEEAVYHLVESGKADEAAPLAADLARHYRKNLRYAEAGHVLDSVISLSPTDELLEPLLQTRGNLYNDLGRYELAADDFQSMIESVSKRDSPNIEESQGFHGLANALSSLGRYEEAVEAYNKSLEIKKQAYGTEEHPEYAASLHGLANALSSLGRYEEAVEAYNKSLEIKKQAYGSDEHPESLPTLTNLAITFSKMGLINQACSEMDRALSTAKALGLPFYIGNIMFLYAQVESSRNTPKAISMAEEAKKILLQVFNASHPTVQAAKRFISKLKGETETGQENRCS